MERAMKGVAISQSLMRREVREYIIAESLIKREKGESK
jgi:hypothetical protein